MRRHLLQSSFYHLAIIAFFFLFHFLRPTPIVVWLPTGFEMGELGGGFKGDGKIRKGSTLKKEHRGQLVPKPKPIPIPDKPAPEQLATQEEEAWKVKNAATKTKPKAEKKIIPVAPKGEKTQKSQSNIIRRGTGGEENLKTFGLVSGTGTGAGANKELGIGLGPGTHGGFGFGGYANILYKRILSEWLQYTPIGTDKSCVIGITVKKSGQVIAVKLEKSSGDPQFDNLARRAIRNSSPMPPLPPAFPNKEQKFRLNFKLLD